MASNRFPTRLHPAKADVRMIWQTPPYSAANRPGFGDRGAAGGMRVLSFEHCKLCKPVKAEG